MLRFFLGLELSCSPKSVFLSQRGCALPLLDNTSFLGSKPVKMSMEANLNLTKDDGDNFDDPILYRRLVGKIVHCLTQFLSSPKVRHYQAAQSGLTVCKEYCSARFFFFP